MFYIKNKEEETILSWQDECTANMCVWNNFKTNKKNSKYFKRLIVQELFDKKDFGQLSLYHNEKLIETTNI